MTVINITRLFDAAKALSTQAGSELQDMIQYLTQALDQILRTLRNGISVSENFDGLVTTVSGLQHATPMTVSVSKTPKHVFPTRLIGNVASDTQTEPMPHLAWYVNSSNQLVITPYFYSQTKTASAGGVLPSQTKTSKSYSVQICVLYS